MVADVILGRNVDTLYWIEILKTNMHENIIVVDYDYELDPETIDEVTYLSHTDAKEFLKNFDSISFYKSIYIYPGVYNSKCLLKSDEEKQPGFNIRKVVKRKGF